MAVCGWSDCPAEVRAQVERYVEATRLALGESLVGLYLHGSLAWGCFNSERSDIDLLGICEIPPDARQLRALAQACLEHSLQPCPIEVSFLSRADLQPWRHPAPFRFHYSEEWRRAIADDLADGAWTRWPEREMQDPDLAAHCTVARRIGVALHGPPPADVLPPVPARDYAAALADDLLWALERVQESPVYGLLNPCRVLAYLQDGLVLSKAEVGPWAQAHLPESLAPWVRGAVVAYLGEGPDADPDAEAMAAWRRWAQRRLRELRRDQGGDQE